ncbi:MAG: hypothetical protein H6523_00930 [Mycolicibacterium sp.]|jgi:hypothetical protein|nr:hypothetical protein [Mycolicibacterium sp.]
MERRIAVELVARTPTPARYLRSWTPDATVAPAGMWISGVVADESGNNYWGLRGADDFLTGMTHVVAPITGFKRLPVSLDPQPPHLFPEYATIDWFEPLQYTETTDSTTTAATTTLRFDSGRIEHDSEGCHWYDAGGRWELHGHSIGDIVTIGIPPQDGIAAPAYYRHELMSATGSIEGTPVSGYLHQDFAYGPPGKVYAELPIIRDLQGMWVSWMQQYDDGSWGGGCCWQGRDGIAFGPGYQVLDGVTVTVDDVRATPVVDDQGRLRRLDAALGSVSYTFEFDTAGSPVHYFGRLTDCSRRPLPVRSWCWVEYAPGMLNGAIMDLVMARYRLARGR